MHLMNVEFIEEMWVWMRIENVRHSWELVYISYRTPMMMLCYNTSLHFLDLYWTYPHHMWSRIRSQTSREREWVMNVFTHFLYVFNRVFSPVFYHEKLIKRPNPSFFSKNVSDFNKYHHVFIGIFDGIFSIYSI